MMVPSTHYEVEMLLVDALIILGGVIIVVGLAWRWRHRVPLVRAAAVALGLAGLVLAAREVDPALSTLKLYHDSSRSPIAGREYCLVEDHADRMIRYINWVRREIPPDSVYLPVLPSTPDGWCLNQALLPRVPEIPGEPFRWTVTFGHVPGGLRRLIREHKTNVRVYKRGYLVFRTPSASGA